jgi:hypothetical protein
MSEQTEQQPIAADGTLNGAPAISSTAEALLAARGNGATPSAPGPAEDGDKTHGPKDVQMTDVPLDQATVRLPASIYDHDARYSTDQPGLVVSGLSSRYVVS